jgi:ribosomal protein L37AE/L43A
METRLSSHPQGAELITRMREVRAMQLPVDKLRCPECDARLSSVHFHEAAIELCSACGGTFFNPDTVRRVAALDPFTERKLTGGDLALYAAGEVITWCIIGAIS